MYAIGIDVGGTHTDAALLKESQVAALAKVPTDHGDLFASTRQALEEIWRHYPGDGPVRLQLSTTLSTNAVVEGRGVPTRVVAVPGPGVNLKSLGLPFTVHELQGYIDHRGREAAPLDPAELKGLRALLGTGEGEAVAVVGKFSQRNPSHEQQIAAELTQWYRGTITLGHRLSGRANFPRRMMTAFLNASVAQQQLEFAAMWRRVLEDLDIPEEDVLVLKADGGTMNLADSSERPIETILSGPAASTMGAQALTEREEGSYVIVDIGGTTTDLAVVVDGEVLYERDGAVISGYRTLVPAVLTRSVGLGGDSELHFSADGKITIGPRRAGAPLCLGGKELTPTDAVTALELADVGSRGKAVQALAERAGEFGLTWRELAERILEAFIDQLCAAVRSLYSELENMPLYTVRDVLNPPDLSPQAVVGLGAPAPVFIPRLAQALGLRYEVLPFSAGANAIGAAAAAVTLSLTLHADTELARLTIPELGCREPIERPLFFDLDKARSLAADRLKELGRARGCGEGAEIYVVEEESFQMVRGFHTVGQRHMVRTQLRPQVRRVRG
ncbi:MAG TPA: hydantoinase/oxoprolinase family protein [Firmicutes bacterium]|nr:hydantoinase/oxoprolinase family protein [Bacillota bacterium]